MKTKFFRLSMKWLLLFSFIMGMISCEKTQEEPPPYIEEEPEDSIGPQKEFIIYDVLSYKNKPNLVPDKISKMEIYYEGHLTKTDPVTGKIVLDMNKINTFAESSAVRKPKMIATDIEDWYGDQSVSGEEMDARLQTMFNVFRSKIPGVKIANYGLPMNNLMLRRYNRNATEEEILSEWRTVSERRWKASASGDYYSPSAYIGVPGVDAWARDLKIMVDEMRAKGVTGKKIYVYLWPQYYNFNDSPYAHQFIDPIDWKKMLETAYKLCDGVILWSSSKDADGNDIDWSNAGVQAMFNATKEFISDHSANIVVEDYTQDNGGDNSIDKTSFKMYHHITFQGTPDLTSHKLVKINLAKEADLSLTTANDYGVFGPDLSKIEALASQALLTPNVPVLIDNINKWIIDRTSNTQAMVDRFALISQTFKSKNSMSKLLYTGVGPTNFMGFRLNEGNKDETMLDSWFRYAAYPMRELRQYADIIVPVVYAINDDIDTWKNDYNLLINEANVNRDPNKPVYAFIWTNYFNRSTTYPFFAEAYKPIKESTFLEMLETIYKRCDGVIIVSNAQSNDPVTWSEDLGLWKAIKTFYNNHKEIIDQSAQ